MNSMANVSVLVVGVVCLSLVIALIKVLHKYWWKPLRIQRLMSRQGINGPPYRFIHGNNKETIKMKQEALRNPMPSLSHDTLPRVQPQILSRIKLYGKNYLSWTGSRAMLVITEPELIKELLKNSERAFPKRTSRERKKEDDFVLKILGDGLVTSEGEKWAKKRKLANHAFHGETLKSMSPAVIASVESMLESYLDGEKIFDMLMKLSVITNRNMFKARLPVISKFWKSADQIEADKLEKEIHNCVMKIVKKREEKVANGGANSFGTDFFGLLLNAYHDTDKKNNISQQDLKARQEVIKIFGNQNPNPEGICKLKIMTMIINETLRLYPPVSSMVRKVASDVQLGKLILPADLELLVPNLVLHHDPHLWGDDVNVFKPERFAEGIANATKHNSAAFIPFGLGPRSCVGMSFALMEMKMALSMILQCFTILLSPTYSHSPFTLLLLQPQQGIQDEILAMLIYKLLTPEMTINLC
ncbi:hypothetical protein GOBAR_AA06565 [Gossypium barbadense]|uniref:Cytochrome P450 CYP749A22-like n=1 Tax=Gossypium barbadense TaxID=3634 RepID=A0A2P5YEQ6_GOSBA|nr:hypothetical protein GOBAR_AA06565 [Gossypium barbadense]